LLADEAAGGELADLSTLPQPRLLYVNRLGSWRGLSCVECHSRVPCPQCGGGKPYFSAVRSAYICPDCSYETKELRCLNCGLSTLAAVSPGLEAWPLSPGDLRISGATGGDIAKGRSTYTPGANVHGTSKLLEVIPGLAPASIVYVHAEGQLGPLNDWPQALDMLARLRSLYRAEQEPRMAVCSSRLLEQLGSELSGSEITRQFNLELRLRKLAGLPPFGCIYKLHLIADSKPALERAREAVGRALREDPATKLLRLGKVYAAGLSQGAGPRARRYRAGGFFSNPRLGLAELQGLRWQVRSLGASLQIQAQRGPWL
jgi:hypothetical protein